MKQYTEADYALAKSSLKILTAHFSSPNNETSIFKGIPNIPEWHHLVNQLIPLGYKLKKRYRGPRGKSKWGNCLKEDAISFTVYEIYK